MNRSRYKTVETDVTDLMCAFSPLQLISAAFEHRAMDLVFYYINLKYNRDVRLAFEALKVRMCRGTS